MELSWQVIKAAWSCSGDNDAVVTAIPAGVVPGCAEVASTVYISATPVSVTVTTGGAVAVSVLRAVAGGGRAWLAGLQGTFGFGVGMISAFVDLWHTAHMNNHQ